MNIAHFPYLIFFNVFAVWPLTQVIDIPSITEHLLVECAGKVNEPDTKVAYDTCPRCHEAVPLSRFPQHVADRKCRGI